MILLLSNLRRCKKSILREVLLYAVVHRDYANPPDIQIKIFDDGITVFSPGKLYGGLTVEDLKTDHYQRNRKLDS